MSAAPSPLASPGPEEAAPSSFARDVLAGLTRPGQKTLPASWLYDAIGSALFEVITLLPEYGLTRADAALLSQRSAEIVRAAGTPQYGAPRYIVELGSGSGTKTRHVLQATVQQGAAADSGPVRYSPIDISGAALEQCVNSLDSLAGVEIDPVEAGYLEGIATAVARRAAHEPILLLFLGSTIGNFSRSEAVSFLGKVRQALRPGDTLLLGTDLVKPAAKLIAAYADPIGATAAFNLNLLARINRELSGHFDLSRFEHEARWNSRSSRVEMHLRSKAAQQVRIDALNLAVRFAAGETIWTESSYKFKAEDVAKLAARAGWRCRGQWVDCAWGFAETLLVSPSS
jgi:dimethylhistidine N-methyltransferase